MPCHVDGMWAAAMPLPQLLAAALEHILPSSCPHLRAPCHQLACTISMVDAAMSSAASAR